MKKTLLLDSFSYTTSRLGSCIFIEFEGNIKWPLKLLNRKHFSTQFCNPYFWIPWEKKFWPVWWILSKYTISQSYRIRRFAKSCTRLACLLCVNKCTKDESPLSHYVSSTLDDVFFIWRMWKLLPTFVGLLFAFCWSLAWLTHFKHEKCSNRQSDCLYSVYI